MVQATKEQTVTITLKLSQLEANWLKGWLQNPLTPSQDPADEDEFDRGMRLSFWNALGGVPAPQPMGFDQPRGIDHGNLE